MLDGDMEIQSGCGRGRTVTMLCEPGPLLLPTWALENPQATRGQGLYCICFVLSLFLMPTTALGAQQTFSKYLLRRHFHFTNEKTKSGASAVTQWLKVL